jgi:hypothetical protein
MSGLPFRRRCRECGKEFWAIRHEQVFCEPACRRAWHSWRESRGARAIELLIKWRRDRRRGSLAALTNFADELVREYRDREAHKSADGRGGALSIGGNLEGGASHRADAFGSPGSVQCVSSGHFRGAGQ